MIMNLKASSWVPPVPFGVFFALGVANEMNKWKSVRGGNVGAVFKCLAIKLQQEARYAAAVSPLRNTHLNMTGDLNQFKSYMKARRCLITIFCVAGQSMTNLRNQHFVSHCSMVWELFVIACLITSFLLFWRFDFIIRKKKQLTYVEINTFFLHSVCSQFIL